MQQTTNYKLNKPELSDIPDITKVSENFDVIDTQLKNLNDLKAPLKSPALTGTPTAPTPANGDNSTKVATTAYVRTALADVDLSTKRDISESVANANLNTLLADKSYICSGTITNAPVATTFCVVEAYDVGTPVQGTIVQICYIPQTDNTVRTFVRSVVNGTVFGAWREMVSDSDLAAKLGNLQMLICENTFRSKAITKSITNGLLMLAIDVFDTTDSINPNAGNGAAVIANYWVPDCHMFNKTDETTVVFQNLAQVVTSGNNKFWGFYDAVDLAEGASIKMEVSRNNGTNFTEVQNDTLTDISSQPAGASVIVRVTLTGKMKFRNIAWGMKA